MLNKLLWLPLQASGYHMSSLDLFQMLTNEVYEEPVSSAHIVRVGMCETWWQLSLLGFWMTFQDLLNVHLPEKLGFGGV